MFKLFQAIPSISTAELAEKLKEKPTILDVRTPSEYQSGHIPGAKNHPLDKINSYRQKNAETVYVICQSGMRSKQAARALKKQGYEVVNVAGGMNRWTNSTRKGKYA